MLSQMLSQIHSSRLACVLVAVAVGTASTRGATRAPEPLPKIRLSEVMDTRQMDGRELLSIGLDLAGVPRGVECLRVRVRAASDSTGASLRQPIEPTQPGFGWEQAFVEDGQATVGAEVLMPTGHARKVARLQGQVEMLLPQRDPDALLLLRDWRKYLGRPLEHGALKRSGLSLRMLSASQFKALPTQARAEAGRDLGDIIGGHAILFVLRDTRRRLAQARFQRPDGSVIAPRTYGYSTDRMLFTFERPLPPNARLRLLIATPKAVVKVPFRFSDIELP